VKKPPGENLRAGAAVLMRGEKGVMPELYARYLQPPNAPWIDAGARAQRGVQICLQQVSSGVCSSVNLRCCPKTSRSTSRFSRPAREKSNVRLVSFTAEEPKHLVESLGFDAALMQALAAIVIALPALREHPEDIPEIATLMLAQLVETRSCPPRTFSTGPSTSCRYFTWPGNLEDLAAAVRNLALTSLEEEIGHRRRERVLPQFAAPRRGGRPVARSSPCARPARPSSEPTSSINLAQ